MLKLKKNLVNLLILLTFSGCSVLGSYTLNKNEYLKPCEPTFTKTFDEVIVEKDGVTFNSVFFVYDGPGKQFHKEAECLIKKVGTRQQELETYVVFNDVSLDTVFIYILNYQRDLFISIELSMADDRTELEGIVSIYTPVGSILHNMSDVKERAPGKLVFEPVERLKQGRATITIKDYTLFRRYLTNGKFPVKEQ